MADNEVIKFGNVENNNKHQSGNVYGVGGVSPTLMAGTHGYGIGYFIQIDEVKLLERYIRYENTDRCRSEQTRT